MNSPAPVRSSSRRITIAFALLLTVSLASSAAFAAALKSFTLDPNVVQRQEVYKRVGAVELKIDIFEPKQKDPAKQYPAIVFFFGGGWTGGSPSQFFNHCQYLATRGTIAMSADYRVQGRQKTTPAECVKDGKSAVRWVRANAVRLGIDPTRIAAGGGSAGGHVARRGGHGARFRRIRRGCRGQLPPQRPGAVQCGLRQQSAGVRLRAGEGFFPGDFAAAQPQARHSAHHRLPWDSRQTDSRRHREGLSGENEKEWRSVRAPSL